MAHDIEPGARRDEDTEYQDKPEGPVAAAVLAAGMGALALGVFTTMAEVSESFKDFLNFYDPVGPLSGKTTYAVVVWLVSWAALHLAYRDKPFETRKALTVALVLLALATIGTFPTFFEAFAPAE